MKNKTISIVLLVTMFLQSCVAYNYTSVSLDNAYDKGRVKIINTYGTNVEFKSIIMVDSIYYGVNRGTETRLDEYQISSIYLQNHPKSNMITIVLIFICII